MKFAEKTRCCYSCCHADLVIEVFLKLGSCQMYAARPVFGSVIQHLCHLHQSIWYELLSEVLQRKGSRERKIRDDWVYPILLCLYCMELRWLLVQYMYMYLKCLLGSSMDRPELVVH